MTNYYIEKDNKIIFVDTDLQRLQNTIIGQDLVILETERPIVNFEFADTPEYIEDKAKKELILKNNEIILQIEELEKKKIRAITDFILYDNNKYLVEYEKQIEDLRGQLNG